MKTQQEMCKLRNGSIVLLEDVTFTLDSLCNLMDPLVNHSQKKINISTLLELKKLALNPSHTISNEKIAKKILSTGLVKDFYFENGKYIFNLESNYVNIIDCSIDCANNNLHYEYPIVEMLGNESIIA